MEVFFQELLYVVEYALIGIGLFLTSYLSNMCFSIYYNIKILGQTFTLTKIIDSGFKVLTFGIGTFLLCIATVGIPYFANATGIELPQEYVEVFSTLAIVGVFLICSCKYVLEAYSKFKLILDQGKIMQEIQENLDKDAVQ